MTRSADRTAANADNATTFYLTNVVPQQADLNQGVWAQFENALADSARAGRAVYIITGPLFSRTHGLTFLKNEGKIAIPDSTWKVAVIGPEQRAAFRSRTANVQTLSDLAGLSRARRQHAERRRRSKRPVAEVSHDRREDRGRDRLRLPVAAPDGLSRRHRSRRPPPVAASRRAEPRTRVRRSTSTHRRAPTPISVAPTSDAPRRSPTPGTSATAGRPRAKSRTTRSTTTARSRRRSRWPTLSAGRRARRRTWPSRTSRRSSLSARRPRPRFSRVTPSAFRSFTDPGDDAAWHSLIDWGNGTTTPAILNTSGASITGSSTFLALGSYTVTLSVTDKDGATGTKSLTVTVSPRPVSTSVDAGSINLNGNGNGNVTLTLTSGSGVDVSLIDVSSIRLGTVGVIPKGNGFQVRSAGQHFDAPLQPARPDRRRCPLGVDDDARPLPGRSRRASRSPRS